MNKESELPEWMQTMQGKGTEELEEHGSMPLLQILQSLSPEIDSDHPSHEDKKIEGAKVGDIIFAPERRILEEPLVVPLKKMPCYVEWKPRSSGGGLIGVHSLDIAKSNQYRKIKYDEFLGDNELHYTIYLSLVFLDLNSEDWTPGIISFSRGMLAAARNFLSKIAKTRYEDPRLKDYTPPVFARKYLAKSVSTESAAGKYRTWAFEPREFFDPFDKEDAEILKKLNASFEESAVMLPAPTTGAKSELAM